MILRIKNDDFKKLISNNIKALENKLKLKVTSHRASESKTDPNSMHYEASALDEKWNCHNLLISEATMRNMSMISLGYESTRAELKMHLNRARHMKKA